MVGDLDNPPVVIRSSRGKLVWLACIGALMTGVCFWMSRTAGDLPHRAVGWFGVLFFGFGELAILVQLLRPTRVSMSPDGLTVQTFRKTYQLPWSDIEYFTLTQTVGSGLVGYKLRDGSNLRSGWAEVSRSLSGVDGALPNTLPLSKSELLTLASRALVRWGGGSFSPADSTPPEQQIVWPAQ